MTRLCQPHGHDFLERVSPGWRRRRALAGGCVKAAEFVEGGVQGAAGDETPPGATARRHLARPPDALRARAYTYIDKARIRAHNFFRDTSC